MISEQMLYQRTNELRRRVHEVIPGGAHTYAKGDDQYPEQAPGFIVRGKGCHVWDVDGNEFIEYAMGNRAVTLGHAYEPVVEAVSRQLRMGSSFTRPSVVELECAELVRGVIDSAEMVKFGKHGSDATSAAVRLSRAYTGRDKVAVCADHPMFSHDDWFIGTTVMSAGIPQAVCDLTVSFRYNDLPSAEAMFAEHPGQIACVILEPEKEIPPADGFLQKLQELCHRNGAVFVLDESITGFRWDIGGAQKVYRIKPDLSAFGKAIANGFSVAALTGRRELMEAGGLYHNRERVYLMSSTNGGEAHALAAAIATIQTYQREDVIGHLHRQGERLQRGINQHVDALGIQDYFQVIGRPCNLIYATRDQERQRSQPFRTLFLQETIKRGLLMTSLVMSYSHTDDDIDRTVEGIGEALKVYKKALEDGVEAYLVGRPVKPVFRLYA
jgi:glutamate-1-semialdehyde 2,1-aminomutase